jgi:hypothetical protein
VVLAVGEEGSAEASASALSGRRLCRDAIPQPCDAEQSITDTAFVKVIR